MTADVVARLCQGGASESEAISSIVEVKIGGLPPYRDRILHAIRSNPGRKGVLLSAIIEKTYGVRIHHATLLKYIVREGLFDAAAAGSSTPIRSIGAHMRSRGKHRNVATIKGRVDKRAKAMKTKKDDAGAAMNAHHALAARLGRLEDIVRTTMAG